MSRLMQIDLLAWQPSPELMIEPEATPVVVQARSPQQQNLAAWYETCIAYNRRQMLNLMLNKDGGEAKQRSRKHLISCLQAECVEWVAKLEGLKS